MNLANFDINEINKFEKLASKWWDLSGESKSLHDINPLRSGYIKKRADLKNARVLDVGCGGGILSEALAGSGADVTGIDMGKEPLAAAKLHLEKSGFQINYYQTTVESMADSEPESFDIIACMELLEHVPDPESVINACYKLLKPGGNIFLATLNRTFKSFIFAIFGAEYILRLLPRGTHRFNKFVKPSEIEQWAEKAGLKKKDLSGMEYNPFTQKYFLSKNAKVNYLMHLKK
ncbi:bifunctional 2-polyprenyl-6-hydroxyphenol methylase/3-demethylubiquinol 3-O-methyltransferase UbiG [Desulfobacterales bacterium HSG17]|nr:bifunctional 2-polyprenyl-6-hydroxyphenol methylase/3-demethylubiquinol 3-O-methyltransferase UbiG [Desulfobacterales bacterium HSG17]